MKSVIGVTNPKGGVSKTTLSVHLAHVAWMEGDDVALVDTDPQGSALDWSRSRPDEQNGPTVIHEDDPALLPAKVQGLDHDVVVLDAPAQLQKMTGKILSLSDLCLVPLEPSALDIWGTEEFRALLEEKANEGTTVALVVARRDPRSTLGGQLFSLAEDYPFEILDGVCQRVAYKRSMAKGETVLEGDDAKAKNEVRELLMDVAQLLSQ
ncbi:chromosome partitioning protein [Salinibacter ruber]|jgi:chromosome partitioning protein|uniref:ParA family protein n=1 Tax=Salinibacter ruber TaxID=146919 RepID=UPI002168F998|nr:ParA family protein [Salinibacter ruber]MCS3937328.1 chromosome partitioning protein [Salinibacter ruber]